MPTDSGAGQVGRIPLVDLGAQYAAIKPEIDDALRRVLESHAFILGGEVLQFEEAFAAFVGASGAVGVSSGTSALSLTMRALGIGHGDEVITTAHTFIATAETVSNVGAQPVFADIDPATYVLDANHVEALITSKTRAILPVHLYGHPAPMAELKELAHQHGLWLIEDAAQAHGAEVDGNRCGSIGHAACFSFYPGKNLGAYGDAGAVTSNDRALLERIRSLRDHGRSSKYEHDEIGYSERMDGLQGAILSAKLPYLERWTEQRRAHARSYSELLRGLDVVVPVEGAGVRHVYHLYVIRTARRDELLAHLRAAGVMAGVHYPVPLHRQPAYVALGYTDSLPHTELAADQVLSLPMYPELSAEQIHHVVASVQEFLA